MTVTLFLNGDKRKLWNARKSTWIYNLIKYLWPRTVDNITSRVDFLFFQVYTKNFKPLKRQTKIAADDILIVYFYLSKKIRLDVSSESSA